VSNRNAIVALALLAIALGCVVVLGLRWYGDTAPAGSRGNVQAPAGDAAPTDAMRSEAGAATDRDAAPRANEALPPWMRSEEEDAPAPAAAGADDSLRQAQLRKLDESVRGLVAASNIGVEERNRHLREALDTLEALDDPAVKAQLDLDAVRDNFEISVRMQALATRLQQIAAQPRSPERQAAIEATSAEMEALQAQMHADVRAPGSTLPPLGTVPGAAARR
jgi:hypothetical protein